MRRTLWASFAVMVAGIVLVGCSRTVVHKKHPPDDVVVEKSYPEVVVVAHRPAGPPAHAPAHGHRKRHAGENITLVYSPDLKVYVVRGHRRCYYSAGQYFRLNENVWQWSVDIGGPWRTIRVESDIPPALRRHHAYKIDKRQNDEDDD